jgi:hypothetical protein
VESGNIIPWTSFQNKQPAIGEINRPELNKLIAANVLNIHLILNTASKQEKEHRKINWEKVVGTGLQIGEMALNHQDLIKNVIKGGIELHNQYKAYSSDGTIELANSSPVYEDKSEWNFVKGVAGATATSYLNSPNPPKNTGSGENFSNTTDYKSKVKIEELTEGQAQEIERQNQNKHAIIKSSKNTEIVKRNNNSQSNSIKQRIKEKNKQKQKKDNNNLNNKNSVVLRIKTQNMPQDGSEGEAGQKMGEGGEVDEEVLNAAAKLGVLKDDKTNSSKTETRIVKYNNGN